MTNLLGGQVSFMVGQASSAVPYVKSGRRIALGVTTPKRLASIPEVPTLSEAGLPGFAAYSWKAVLAPRGTPRAIVDKLNHDINAVITSADLRKVFTELGLDRLDPANLAGAASFITAETAKWTRVIRGASVKAD